MNRTYRIAGLVIGLAAIVTAAVSLDPSAPSTDPEATLVSLDPAVAVHVQEEHAPEESGDPALFGEGETAQEAAQYAADQAQSEQPPQWQAIDDHVNATRGPEQPIPFNHRFHATDLQIDCMYCHTGTERSAAGIVPAMDVCMGCHIVAGTGLPPIERLREMYRAGQVVEWEWVNKLPEFVQFNHRAHLRNDIECAACHGPVEEMDRVYQWAPFTMGWCLECHRSAPQETDYATDHLLGQMAREGELDPEGPQDLSFYPRAIDSQYGDFRAPTDCAACHY